ncbi:hypothetical protein AB0M43_14275 [Longispora sp. NPDC051575]|uniref:hypothetical protein n=1 Tax=Longispora sp. NPDC051575 TaxID=3154943 RepID=UPI00341DACA3
MGLFRRFTGTPPTPFGYQPPPEAVVRSWICADPGCGHSGPGSDPRRWPRRCPECDAGIRTDRLAEPWEHQARRQEIDARLAGPPRWSGDLDEARAEDAVWWFADALAHTRPELAAERWARIDRLIKETEAAQRTFHGGYHRWNAFQCAVDHGHADLAAHVLRDWYAAADTSELEDNGRRTNCRQLASCLITFLEHPVTAPSPHAEPLWSALTDLMARMRDVTTADHIQGYARLGRLRAGGNNEEESLLDALRQLRIGDHRAAPEEGARPTDLGLRMLCLAWHERGDQVSGLDGSLVWDVCLRPVMEHARADPRAAVEAVAAAVLPGAGWEVFGASRCLQEYAGDEPGFLPVLDAALEFLHGQGWSERFLNGVERRRWHTTHGPDSW